MIDIFSSVWPSINVPLNLLINVFFVDVFVDSPNDPQAHDILFCWCVTFKCWSSSFKQTLMALIHIKKTSTNNNEKWRLLFLQSAYIFMLKKTTFLTQKNLIPFTTLANPKTCVLIFDVKPCTCPKKHQKHKMKQKNASKTDKNTNLQRVVHPTLRSYKFG